MSRLIPAPHNYPSPGAMAEYLYLYVSIADLPDDIAGLGGLASEDEDIRSHLIPRAELTRMALAGEIRNGPLLYLALWLELRHDEIRRELELAEPAKAQPGLPPSRGSVYPGANILRKAKPMRICPDLASDIGNTPLIRLRRASEETGCEILGK